MEVRWSLIGDGRWNGDLVGLVGAVQLWWNGDLVGVMDLWCCSPAFIGVLGPNMVESCPSEVRLTGLDWGEVRLTGAR